MKKEPLYSDPESPDTKSNELEDELLSDLETLVPQYIEKRPENENFMKNPDDPAEHEPNWHQFGIITHTRKFSEFYRTEAKEYFQDWDHSRNYTGVILAEPNAAAEYLYARTDKGAGYWRVYRTVLPFDTSNIPEDAEIRNVSLNLYGLDNRGDVIGYITEHFPEDPTNIQKTDWNISNFSYESFGDEGPGTADAPTEDTRLR